MDEKQDKDLVKWSQADEAMLLQTLADEKTRQTGVTTIPRKLPGRHREEVRQDLKNCSGYQEQMAKNAESQQSEAGQEVPHQSLPTIQCSCELVDSTEATGKNAFHAGQTSAFNPTQPQTCEPTPYDFSIDPTLQDILCDMESVLGDETSMQGDMQGMTDIGQTENKYNKVENGEDEDGYPSPMPVKIQACEECRTINQIPESTMCFCQTGNV
ncbi:hypothetical protein EDB85DRAFT_1897446 [Lactarius pseudohatsudake]|nr:hypothetical protein EDB85DRAFT_1897446 [Lactarius pseudohatsudake]